MKIVYEMQGIFRRNNARDGKTDKIAIALSDLCGNLRAIAGIRGYRHVSRVQKEFGFEFLPQRTFESLLTTLDNKSPLLANNILKIYPFEVDEINYTYLFESNTGNIAINLDADDPQLPRWSGETCHGTYSLIINKDNHNTQFSQIIDETLTILKSVDPIEILKSARKSPGLFPIYLKLSDSQKVTVWQSLGEVDKTIQEAVSYLDESTYSVAPENVAELIGRYKTQYSVLNSYQLPLFSILHDLRTTTNFIIGRNKHRQILTDLIESANNFLAIASFRLEDKSIIDLIAKKAKTLPQGVWILTELGNDVLDKIDTDIQGKIEHEEEYFESNLKKRECLRLLTEAGAFIRSGLFHVKFLITEKQAYLGSCNLTGGSLERNGEAGIIWQNTEQHYDLLQYFQVLWQEKTQAEIIPSPQGIRSTSIANSQTITSIKGFLNYFDYMADLEKNLLRFSKDPNGKVYLYGRSINPSFPQKQVLNNLRTTTKIFYGWKNYSSLHATLIKHLHAKVVILGEQVAYLGTQDIFVSINPAHDLTYKTTNPAEIKSILDLLHNLH